MGANDPQVGLFLAHRAMIGRTYVVLHMTLLHTITKYTSFGSCRVWTPGVLLTGFIKWSKKYTLLHVQNIHRSSGSCGFVADFFLFLFSQIL